MIIHSKICPCGNILVKEDTRDTITEIYNAIGDSAAIFEKEKVTITCEKCEYKHIIKFKGGLKCQK